MEMSNVVASFVIFAVITGLWTIIYTGFQDTYHFVPNDLQDGKNIMQKLNDINIISGLNQTVTGVYELKAPTGAKADILGALASAAIGVLKMITGVITFPVEIIGVITGFYYIPPVICVGAGIIFIIYISFLLWDAYKGK